MPKRHPAASSRDLPLIWLVSDARNDAALETALRRLPRGSGLIFRHYHLEHAARRRRFDRLARIARRFGHRVVLAGTMRQARRWRADGAYGPADRLAGGPPGARLVTAHALRDIGRAQRSRASLIVLSPAFATRSHPGANALGPLRFRRLAAHAIAPVIALGGMTRKRARRLQTPRWAAIDGLTP